MYAINPLLVCLRVRELSLYISAQEEVGGYFGFKFNEHNIKGLGNFCSNGIFLIFVLSCV